MTFRTLSAAILAVSLVLGLTGTADAKTMKITPKDPIAIVDVPDGWLTDTIDRGIEVKTKDEEVIAWFEAYRQPQFKDVMNEHTAYFRKQGVDVKGEPKTETSTDGGVTVVSLDFPATWNGKPTILRYLSIDLNLPSKKLVLVSYWASPEGDKRYGPAVSKMIRSFTPLAQ